MDFFRIFVLSVVLKCFFEKIFLFSVLTKGSKMIIYSDLWRFRWCIVCMRAICLHPWIFDFHQRVTYQLWTWSRNKIWSKFQFKKSSKVLLNVLLKVLLFCTIFSMMNWSFNNGNKLRKQFVIFKPPSYCFEETVGFSVKASFAGLTVSRLIRWYNKPGDITEEFWEKAIQLLGNFHGLKIANWKDIHLLLFFPQNFLRY